jgi:hypothetical protein
MGIHTVSVFFFVSYCKALIYLRTRTWGILFSFSFSGSLLFVLIFLSIWRGPSVLFFFFHFMLNGTNLPSKLEREVGKPSSFSFLVWKEGNILGSCTFFHLTLQGTKVGKLSSFFHHGKEGDTLSSCIYFFSFHVTWH